MGNAGYYINGASVLLIIFFNVIFCLREFLLPIADGPPLASRSPLTCPVAFYSTREPNYRPTNELQQRHPSRHYLPYRRVVVHSWLGELSGSKTGTFIH
jgi:hypothetical protein